MGAGLAIASCAPAVQKPVTGEVTFSGPQLTDNGFVSFDGARLGLRVWPAKGETKAIMLGLHGMNDYSAAFRMVAPYLAEHGVTTYAIDQRGFGISPNTGIWAGEDLLINDAAALEQAARAAYPGLPVTMMGISMGGAVAIRAAAEKRIHPDRLILAAPAVWGWSAMPPVYRMALWLGAHTRPDQNVLPPKNLKIVASDNNKMLYENWKDPLFLKKTRIDSIYGLVGLMEDASKSVANLPPNTLYLYGAHDQIIPPKAAFRSVRRLPATTRTIYYPKGYHMLTRDLNGALVWADILAFIQDPEAKPPSGLGAIPVAKQTQRMAQGRAPQGNP
ncbi:MAG: alpha/beta fold hydrolase [Caulobacterales bacterium]